MYTLAQKNMRSTGNYGSKSYLGWIIVSSTNNPLEDSMSMDEFTDYRTRHIIPYQGHEISSDVHPFNCGLEHLVHEAKGCYIGQEILTRYEKSRENGQATHSSSNRFRGCDKCWQRIFPCYSPLPP